MSPLHLARRGLARSVDLLPMTPIEQLHDEAYYELMEKLYPHWGVSFGTVVIVTSFLVLLLWIPLRQWPGLGTLLNSVLIGLATDATLRFLAAPEHLVGRWGLLLGGIVANGLAGALYIGSQFGPGPRDGLMTGFARRTGRSIRLVRTSIEVTVLVLGWFLGGTVGLGTVLYAVLIGPIVQFFLPILTVRVHPPAR